MAKNGVVRIGDVTLAYLERGGAEPVVLVHGSLADASYWERSRQLDLLGERFRVIAYSRRYNHPNHNPVVGDHSPYVEAADLVGVVDGLGLDRIHLVGHSYGAYTALAFALEHPSRLRSLVVAEPPILAWLPEIPGGDGIQPRFMANVWEPLARAFRDEGDEGGLEFTAHWYFRRPFDAIDPAWQTLFRNNVAEWRALAASPDTFPSLDQDGLRRLSVPTLILSGAANAGGFNDVIDRHLHGLIVGSERLVIAEAGHEMFLDAPEATAAAMLAHFERHGLAGVA